MLLNTKRDILTRRIQQYESALADITMLQDRSLEREHNSHLADLIAFGDEISAELSMSDVETIQHHVQADSLPRTLEVEFEREHNSPAFDTQKPPITAQQALRDLGAQGTTVPVRVNDPSPISLEQPGTLANTTSSLIPSWAKNGPSAWRT